MNFYSFHIGDYARDTRHLSWDEDMAYRRMMDAYYANEAPLPPDKKQIYRLISAKSARQQAAADAVLAEFFIESPQGFTNSRCEEELSVAKTKSETREEKQANERERQKRHRERRKNLFNQLRELDIVPAFDTTTEALEAMLAQRVGHEPVTRDVTGMQRLTNPTNQSQSQSQSQDRTGGGLDWASIESQLRKAAGWEREPHPKLAVVGPIVAMIEAGASLEKDVLPIIKALAPGVKTRTSWSYFLKPIEQSWRERTGFVASGANGFHVQQVDASKWEERVEWARKNQQWGEVWGPMPGKQGCAVPANLLKPEDGQGWTIWKQSA